MESITVVSVYQNLHEQYNKLKSLQKNDKICTETEPAWCANEAKILLDTMVSNIENLMTNVGKESPVYFRFLGMKCTLMYEEAKFLVNIENEEQAQEIMSKSLDLIKEDFMKPELTFLILRIINHYSFLFLKQGEFDKPLTLLEEGERMYNELKSKVANPQFFTAEDIFLPTTSTSPKKDTPEKLDRLMTNNLLMLGFVHSKKGHHEKYAYYNHQVLNRQLKFKDSEATTWAMKAVKLASYFISKNRFREARHHLAAACQVLEESETELKNSEPNEANVQKWEELQLRFSDVAKCWVKYGLFLFGVSKSRLVSFFYGEPNQFLENLWLPPYDIYPVDESAKSKSSPQEEIEGLEINVNEISVTRTTSNTDHSESEQKVKEETVCNTPQKPEDVQVKLSPSEISNENTENTQNQIESKENLTKLSENTEEESGISKDIENSSKTTECTEHSEEVTKDKNDDKDENDSNIQVKSDEEIIPSNKSTPQPLHILFTSPETKESESIHENTVPEEDKNLLLFPSLDLTSRENEVTIGYIESVEQARALFLYTHAWLKRSKLHYTLKDNPMEYVNAILDLSELYRYMAFYEEDVESQYSVQKRRADALETLSTVLKEVRPKCYMAVSIELLRELAEVQLEMMGLNLRRLYAAQEAGVECHGPTTDFTLHKMEAMADIHSHLEQIGDRLGHRADLGDGLSDVSGDNLPQCV